MDQLTLTVARFSLLVLCLPQFSCTAQNVESKGSDVEPEQKDSAQPLVDIPDDFDSDEANEAGESSQDPECIVDEDCTKLVFPPGWFRHPEQVSCSQHLRICVECKSDDECATGELCGIRGDCAVFVPCRARADCPGSLASDACINGRCRSCTQDSECGPGYQCLTEPLAKIGSGAFLFKCLSTDPTLIDQTCIDGSCTTTCQPVSRVDPNTGVETFRIECIVPSEG